MGFIFAKNLSTDKMLFIYMTGEQLLESPDLALLTIFFKTTMRIVISNLKLVILLQLPGFLNI